MKKCHIEISALHNFSESYCQSSSTATGEYSSCSVGQDRITSTMMLSSAAGSLGFWFSAEEMCLLSLILWVQFGGSKKLWLLHFSTIWWQKLCHYVEHQCRESKKSVRSNSCLGSVKRGSFINKIMQRVFWNLNIFPARKFAVLAVLVFNEQEWRL